MLILTRKPGESVVIAPDAQLARGSDPRSWFVEGPIRVRVTAVRHKQVKIGIEAPRMFKILRDELINDVPVSIPSNRSVRDLLAAKVRILRRLYEWSDQELADTAALSLTTLACIESGLGRVEISDLEALAEAFEISVVELLLPPGRTVEERLVMAGLVNGE